MFLVEANTEQLARAIAIWDKQEPSFLLHHGEPCCDAARDWFISMDNFQLISKGTSNAPSWIRQHYQWGPSDWPLYWCQAVESSVLDCGALAALAHHSFNTRGIPTFPAQLVQLYTAHNCAHWAKSWGDKTCSWIYAPYVYHEVCAVTNHVNGNIELWDPTSNYWITPSETIGYASPVAVKILSNAAAVFSNWHKSQVHHNVWTVLV